jgi:hypothetical protein
MTRCDVQATGAIELYFYGELDAVDGARIDAHLLGCAACREALEEMSVIRAALASRPDVSAPEGGDWSAFMARLDHVIRADVRQPAVPKRSRFSAKAGADVRRATVRPSYVGYLAMAALLALVTVSVLFVARSREATIVPDSGPRTTENGPRTPDPGPRTADRQLVSLSERHFERSKLVVLGMATKNAAQADWQYERELAEGLLNDTRMYRITAEGRGMTRLAGVLRDLEIVLLQTSLTDEKDPAALAQIQRLIRKRDLVEQMDVVTTEGN